MEIRDLAEQGGRVIDEVERAVIGKREQLELVLLGVLGDGHVLLEDVPGLAKTLTARSFAEAIGLGFSRVQFTPDLLPADVTGSSIWNQRDNEFEFRSGPIFTHILLADEINRAPPKTQAALLEAMQERQVTTDGVTRPLERPFLVLATQNPIEYEGTYPLPEAQLDRFLLRTGFGYPDADAEWEMLARRIERRGDDVTISPVIDRETLLEMQAAVELVHIEPSVGRYIVELVAATRESSSLAVGASPRGSLALLKLSRCRAALAGRDFVTPDDVKAVAVPALAHRLVLKPELWVQRRSGEDVVRETLAAVPTPAAEAPSPETTLEAGAERLGRGKER
jgi:MoxR-like ATPase